MCPIAKRRQTGRDKRRRRRKRSGGSVRENTRTQNKHQDNERHDNKTYFQSLSTRIGAARRGRGGRRRRAHSPNESASGTKASTALDLNSRVGTSSRRLPILLGDSRLNRRVELKAPEAFENPTIWAKSDSTRCTYVTRPGTARRTSHSSQRNAPLYKRFRAVETDSIVKVDRVAGRATGPAAAAHGNNYRDRRRRRLPAAHSTVVLYREPV
ncbi:hypothetical protein EVAR_42523_1 [Eumeta japonica]|uniref:Uncharacterized protein n=1 Tax=Eumeta variegata TaxID=151549 RepID=A0A4C1XI83_EUMVA|nr:hypothetical protein EVAR_42523_1 [Eumeta japonica]